MDEKGSIHQCLGKKAYRTLEFAEDKAKFYTEKYNKPQRVYFCGICNKYHITSKER